MSLNECCGIVRTLNEINMCTQERHMPGPIVNQLTKRVHILQVQLRRYTKCMTYHSAISTQGHVMCAQLSPQADNI